MNPAIDHVGLHARLRPDSLAAHDLARDRRWTYRQLDEAVARTVTALIARGAGVGDRVAALAKNRVELAVLHLACARLGAIYTPLNWRLSARELEALIADAEPSLLLGDDTAVQVGLDHTSIDAFLQDAEDVQPTVCGAIDPDRPSLLLYTSGTSGQPKGALLSERNIGVTAQSFSVLGQVTHKTVVLCDAPMFHVIGLVTNIRPTLLRGGALLVSDSFIPARTLQRLSDPALGVTQYFCVPQMAAALRALPEFDPEKLRGLTALFTGGAPHPAAAIRAWLADGIAVVDGYGMSEAGTVLGMPIDRDLIDRRAGCAGVPAPGVRVRIVDDQGRDCAPGEPGELWIKGDNVMSGYWRRPAETAASLGADGWLRSGDIARADEEGYCWLVDRRKDMFISGGENVYPGEVEALLADHPAIAECALVGVSDATWGEVGHLALVARPGVPLDPQQVLDSLYGQVARYKLPKHVSVLDALPRNGANKILKRDLKTMLDPQK